MSEGDIVEFVDDTVSTETKAVVEPSLVCKTCKCKVDVCDECRVKFIEGDKIFCSEGKRHDCVLCQQSIPEKYKRKVVSG